MSFAQRCGNLGRSLRAKTSRRAARRHARNNSRFRSRLGLEPLEAKRMLAAVVVDTLTDTVFDDGRTSLREAIQFANFNPGVDVITFSESLAGRRIDLRSGSPSDFGPTALGIGSEVHILGPANGGITIGRDDSVPHLRIFSVAAGARLVLANATIADGVVVGPQGGTGGNGGGGGGGAGLGGAILNDGELFIVNSTFVGNAVTGGAGGTTFHDVFSRAPDSGGDGAGPNGGAGRDADDDSGATGRGGGIFSGGGGGRHTQFLIPNGGGGGFGGGGGGGGGATGSGIIAGSGGNGGRYAGDGHGGQNLTPCCGIGGAGGGGAGLGGAIFNNLGTVTIINSTFHNNFAIGGPGGIPAAEGNPPLDPGDPGSGQGGAIFNYGGTLIVTNSTITENFANEGGGIKLFGPSSDDEATARIDSTIIANSLFSNDYSADGDHSSGGEFNLIRLNDGFGGQILLTSDPLLGPLQNNGGPSHTRIPRLDSPVIDRGFSRANLFGIFGDQRGSPRPVDQLFVSNSIGGDGSDIGSYERFDIFPPERPNDGDGTPNQVAEGAPHGTFTGLQAQAEVTTGDSARYSLTDDAGGRFQIDPFTGHVQVGPEAHLIDFETATSHEIVVRATDSEDDFSETRFEINVTDVFAPLFDADDSANVVLERSAVGTPVGIRALAPEPNGPLITYEVANDAGGRFGIGRENGIVFVADTELIDPDANAQHTIVVNAFLLGSLYSSSVHVIDVLDSESTPLRIAEGSFDGAPVGAAATINRGRLSHGDVTVTYELLDTAGGQFNINSATGQLRVSDNGRLNFEEAAAYRIIVRVAIHHPEGVTVLDEVHHVAVTNVAPSSPRDTDNAPNEVTSTIDGATVGITLESRDPLGPDIEVRLTDDAGGRFAIDPDTGIVTVADGSLLDFQSGGTLTITAEASDGFGGVSTADFPILFAPLQAYVDDDFAGTPLGADPDGDGPATAFGTDSFVTIQEGVDAVGGGGQVSINPGVYAENVVIDQTVTLEGTSGTAADVVIQPASGDAVTATAGGVALRDLRIQNAFNGIRQSGNGNLNLDNVELFDNQARGVNVDSARSVEFVNVRSLNNGQPDSIAQADEVTIDTGAGDDQIDLNTTAIGGEGNLRITTAAGSMRIGFADVGQLTVDTSAGDDEVNVAPHAATTLILDGGDHSPAGDTLQYTPTAARFTVFDTTIATAGHTDIQHQNFELQQREYTVDLLDDELDSDYSAGDVSLREAVGLANGLLGAGTVRFDSSLTSTDQRIELSQVETSAFGPTALEIQGDVSIVGPGGDAGVTISRGTEFAALRLFHVLDTGSLTLKNLTVSGGRAAGEHGGTGFGGGGGGGAGLGGAIFNEGQLTIVASTLTENVAVGGFGGNGSFQFSGSPGGGPNGGTAGEDGGLGGGGGGGRRNGFGSPFPAGNGGFGGGGGGAVLADAPGTGGFGAGAGGNIAGTGGAAGGGGAGLGGAIFNHGGRVDVINSTISANSAHGGGSGIGAGSGESGFIGQGLGGGIFNRDGVVNISNSTLADNFSDGGGGSIYNLGDQGEATLSVNSSIVANSVEDVVDLVSNSLDGGSTATSGGQNLIQRHVGYVGGIVSADDPLLGPLQDNGGPTPTHALLDDSPAIDAGANPHDLIFDQRGADFERVSGAAVDVGAFERQFTGPQVVSVQIDDGSDQRSVLRSIEVTFDSIVTIGDGAFEITESSGSPVGVNVTTQTVEGRTVVLLTFFGGAHVDTSGSLRDGNYSLSIRGDLIRNAAGEALDGDGDGTEGGDRVDQFFRLLGDADGDRDVDMADLLAFRSTFRRLGHDSLFDRAFDFDNDGDVDVRDLFDFRRRFRTTLAP